MLHKRAKEILKAIIADAAARKTYYVISKHYMPWLGSLGDPQRLAKDMDCNDDIWSDVYKLNQRHERFKHHMEEIAPDWVEVNRIHYADNSIEAVQENKNGDRRQVMVEAPHGDVCY